MHSSIEQATSDELPIQGVKSQLTARILECSRGGFIIVFDNHGMASRSTWGEAIDCIAETGCKVMHWDMPEPTPDMFYHKRAYEDTYREPRKNLGDVLHAIGGAVITTWIGFMAFIGIRTT